ncbi:hypothetical protein ACWIUD_08960 [Helicobacter sp. 23-1044]
MAEFGAKFRIEFMAVCESQNLAQKIPKFSQNLILDCFDSALPNLAMTEIFRFAQYDTISQNLALTPKNAKNR